MMPRQPVNFDMVPIPTEDLEDRGQPNATLPLEFTGTGRFFLKRRFFQWQQVLLWITPALNLHPSR
jgi:hypothetical protein